MLNVITGAKNMINQSHVYTLLVLGYLIVDVHPVVIYLVQQQPMALGILLKKSQGRERGLR